MVTAIDFIRARPEHDDIMVAHYLAIWESYDTPQDHLREDAQDIIRTFLRDGRQHRKLASFIAFDGNMPAGSVSCQLHTMPYPVVLKPQHMLQGYIWSVYSDPLYRGRGVAKKLVSMAVEHLREAGCTTAVLHASEAGKPLYAGMGFELAMEMRMKLGP